MGTPKVVLSKEEADKLVEAITQEEVDRAICQLNCHKAEGMDQLTNEMLKSAGPQARKLIMRLFNNVLETGRNPKEWKVGNIILALKRPSDTDIANYRPITLISCLSKLLTKIIAERLSAAAESSGIQGDNQNGFCAGCCCADNIFILNSVLEFNRSRKMKSFLLFVDLQEAYDRVDRTILFRKLEQMNFPDLLINYLQDYYANDYITTDAAGVRTSKQYQTRGLRQGCNLSSILFIIYISELGQRLNESGCGVTLPSGEVISYLKFADDIFLVSNCEDDLDELKQILEGWCYNFRMKISAKKTQVIAQGEFDWVITDTDGGDLIQLRQVAEYKYLGVEQKLSLTETSRAKGLSMVDRAKKYRGAIARLKRTVPDQVAVYRALWESVAVPGILYGAEALPVSMAVIKELDDIQRWVAKVLLGVGTSTIGAVSELEMGFRPFHMRILIAKINFYLKVKSGKGKCELSRTCLELLGTLQSSAYLSDLESCWSQ